MKNLSIIIPCKNEQDSIGSLLEQLTEHFSESEIIVIDDGSTDNTANILAYYDMAQVISNPYSKGNGAAIKSGANIATRDILLFMDADGQHTINAIPQLIAQIDNGHDMVIGARDNKSQASTARLVGNKFYNKLASVITGHKITDLTSGFRACKRKLFLEFISLLPNGFSYPTTITMAFFRSGYNVKYIPVKVKNRNGKSHISILKDGIRFLLIIFKIAALYSPLKLFAPISALFFSSGICYYLYTYFSSGRFTNMGVLLIIISVLILVFSLISEQITMLLYLKLNKDQK